MIETFFVTSPWWAIYLATVFYFLILYFGFALTGEYLTYRLLPKHHIGHRISENSVYARQKKREILSSLRSITVFGFFGLLPRLFYDWGIINIDWGINWKTFPFELLFIFFWNELHFYASHRLLHTKWLFRRVHIVHHRSHLPTPFSTYSFHWAEAMVLSTVMILPMFFYSFSYLILFILPFMSIFFNMLGHWHYTLFPVRKHNLLKFSEHHSLHHSNVNGNFGFFMPYFDRIFGTELKNSVNTKD